MVENKRQKLLPELVSEDVMIKAGFNYWEPSLLLDKNGLWCKVYISYLEDRNLNLVITEDIKVRKTGRCRDWYFGTFSGTYLGENPEYSIEEYTILLREIMSRKHRVSGSNLERLISQVIEESLA